MLDEKDLSSIDLKLDFHFRLLTNLLEMNWINNNKNDDNDNNDRKSAYRYVSSFNLKTSMMQSRLRFLCCLSNSNSNNSDNDNNFQRTLIQQYRSMHLNGLSSSDKHGIIQVRKQTHYYFC